MLDDFFSRALLAGLGVALVAGPLGCFIVWRRLSYFGDTLAHSALLGVALALLLDQSAVLAVFVVAAGVSVALIALQSRGSLASDAILGLLAHSTLALGLVCLAFVSWVRVDLMGYLFGDILAVSSSEIAVIYGVAIAVLAILAWLWRPLFAATVNRELAQAEGLDPNRANMILMLLLAAVIAVAMKIVGVLLVTALLIIPAATARRFVAGPEQMAIAAALAGGAAVIAGLFGSRAWDTPSGPSIVVAAFCLFLLSLTPLANLARRHRHDSKGMAS